MKRILIAGLLCLTVLPLAFAQTIQATLSGTVSVSAGALIPGVAITATNTATGVIAAAITNEAGAYQFASLQTCRRRIPQNHAAMGV